MYAAERGRGAACNGQRIEARVVEVLEQEETIGVGGEALKLLDFSGFPSRQRNSGTVGSDIVFTARGALLANVSRNDLLYHVAAPLAIASRPAVRRPGGTAVRPPSSTGSTTPSTTRP